MVKEGKAVIDIKVPKKISKEMDVFYNPVMKFNRDMAVLVLNCIPCSKIGLPLEASGIRGIRMIKEVIGKKEVFLNDISPDAVKMMKKNFKSNKIKDGFKIFNQDANIFLLENKGFDYIDIDPFGSPNPFLDSAVKAISREGIIAVTATDTAPLAGTYPSACIRKYWAKPLRDDCMHETALRILCRKVQLIGMQYERAMVPIFSYYNEHYYRMFFRAEKGKKRCDEIAKQFGDFNGTGPMFLGNLNDEGLLKKMIGKCGDDKAKEFLSIILDECKANIAGFVSINTLGRQFRLGSLPKREKLISAIKKKGFKACGTHITGEGIKTDMGIEKIGKLIRNY